MAHRLAAPVTLALALALSTLEPGAQTTQPQPSPEQVRERWNKVFKEDAPSLDREPSKVLVAAVEQRKPGKALDLGTGQGRNAIFLASKGWTVTGVDISDVAHPNL